MNETTLGLPLSYAAKPEPEGWTLYTWNDKRMQWMGHPKFTNVSLEVALTTMLSWRVDGQTVRIDSVANLL